MAVQPSSTPESCCICEEEYTNVTDLVAHLIQHCEDPEFKEMLEDTRILYEEPITPSKSNYPEFTTINFDKTSSLDSSIISNKRSSSPIVVDLSDSDEEIPSSPMPSSQSSKSSLTSARPIPPRGRGRPSLNKNPLSQSNVKNKTASKTLSQSNTVPHKKAIGPKAVREPTSSSSIQEKPRPFSCNICNKSFAYKGTLRQHLRNHIGDKSYPCPKCSKCFTIKDVLRKHIQEVHKAST